MKRVIIITVFLLTAVPALLAQKGMHISELFTDKYREQKNVTELFLKGKMLKDYNLTLFRSLTVANDPRLAAHMERLVRADGKQSVDKEEGMKGGQLYYAFYTFKNPDGSYRYLFFRNNLLRPGEKQETTMVYMEGKATLSELKKLFR